MGMYRKKPVIIEAREYTGDNFQEILKWIRETSDSSKPPAFVDRGGNLAIRTLEGDHRASPGDMIIRGIQGEFYPCKPDIFAATYESVAAVNEN